MNQYMLIFMYEKILVFFWHSLDSADYNYFFGLFDLIDISNVTKDGKIVFAFYIYEKEKEDKIRAEHNRAIAALFKSYSKSKGNSDPYRLLDYLISHGKVFLMS